jgi:hypothetical protein
MLDFCAEHGIAAEIEVVSADQIIAVRDRIAIAPASVAHAVVMVISLTSTSGGCSMAKAQVCGRAGVPDRISTSFTPCSRSLSEDHAKTFACCTKFAQKLQW